MTWAAARSALLDAIIALPEVDQVFTIVSPSGDDLRGAGVAVIVAPPARRGERTPGRLEKSYTATVTVGRALESDPQGAALQVDAAVEAIDGALESHVTLGGTVTSTAPITWGEAAVVEFPEGSRVEYVTMSGTFPVTIVTAPARSA